MIYKYKYNIYNDLTGRYTFLWEWNFNSKGAGDTYTSCWEADIVADKNARNNKLNQRRLPVRDPGMIILLYYMYVHIYTVSHVSSISTVAAVADLPTGALYSAIPCLKQP